MTELKTLKDVIDYIDWLWGKAEGGEYLSFDGGYSGYTDDTLTSSGDY